MERFTYCFVDLGINQVQLKKLCDLIKLQIDPRYWYRSCFRKCDMLVLYSEGGKSGPDDFDSIQLRQLEWTEAAMENHKLRVLLEELLFPWFSPMGRIAVIKTSPGDVMSWHLDCSQKYFNRMNPKFRLVLSGQTETLYFLRKDYSKEYIRPHGNCFVMDGSHLHGMTNSCAETKLTLCVGSPWDGSNGKLVDKIKLAQKVRISRPPFQRDWEDPRLRK